MVMKIKTMVLRENIKNYIHCMDIYIEQGYVKMLWPKGLRENQQLH